MTAPEPATPESSPAFVPPALPQPGAPLPIEPDASPAADLPPENVGRGVLFSLGGIVVGAVLTVVLWRLNFIAAASSLALAVTTVWLYAKGAGRPPAKGAMAVVAVIVAGVGLSLTAALASDAVAYLLSEYPDATLAEHVDAVLWYISLPEVWSENSMSILIYIAFAALGTFGLVRQLGRAKGA